MKLKFFKASSLTIKAKATIQKSGKLGFSNEATGYLNLKENTFIKFAQNEENPDDTNLYAILNGVQEEDSFKICKAGDYFYVNTKGLFDSLEYNYTNNTIIFDLLKIYIEGQELVKMQKREISKQKKGGKDKE